MARRPSGHTVRDIPLFRGLDKREASAVARLGTPARIRPGQLLTRQGGIGHEFFTVLSGFAHCEINGRVVANFGPGDFFGEVALLDGGPRTATVTALTEMEVMVFTNREFTALVCSSGEVAYRLMSRLSGRLRQANVA